MTCVVGKLLTETYYLVLFCFCLFSFLVKLELTDPEEHHHAEHGQQSGDDHPEERRQLLLLPLRAGGPRPGAAGPPLRGLAGRGGPRLGLIHAGAQPVVEEGGPLRHVGLV